MLLIILKSSACLAVFMLFYKLCLEQTSAHNFKRFYLLGILFISVCIPLITFTSYIDVPLVSNPFNTPTAFEVSSVTNTAIENTTKNYLPILLWSLYSVGVVLFLYRFLLNLAKLTKKIKQNPKQKFKNLNLVLLHDKVPPHTFFNHIFLNKNDFESHKINASVLLHEQTHALQKHTIDIIIVELIQIIFWFNPLLVLLKKYIKLNHEFLADQSVLNAGTNTTEYQNILLAFSSNAQHSQLVNPINYASLKKRFKIMTTKTSKSSLILRSLLLLPVIVLSVHGFSQKETVIKPNYFTTEKETGIKDIRLIIKDTDNLVLNGEGVNMESLKEEVNKQNPGLTTKQKQDFLFAYLLIENEDLYSHAKKISKFLYENCGIRSSQIVIVNGYNNLNLYKSPFKGKTITEAQNILDNQTIDLTPVKKTNSPWKVTAGVNNTDLTLNRKLYISKSINQKDLDEYNNLVKKFNALPRDRKVVKATEFSRLYELYRLIPEEKHSELLPFPDFLTPPTSDKKTVIDIINTGAICYLNQKKITSREAISMINSNAKLNVSTIHDNGKTVVMMYTEAFPKFPPPPPVMDTISTYNSLAKRTKLIPNNRNNNLQYLKTLYNKLSNSQKEKVESPSAISKYIRQFNSRTD